ncbi:hypothetical protein GIB64_06725 [Pseudomonas lactis]|nr:hypothetical protein [Pseudomonas lactis]
MAIRYSGTRLLRRDRHRERPFYGSCNRVRLSASGWLHGCLSSSKSHYLGDNLCSKAGIMPCFYRKDARTPC